MSATIKSKAVRSVVITLALLLLTLAQGRGATSPFEIDISELAKNRPATRAVKKKPHPPARKPPGRDVAQAKPAAVERQPSGYVRYTVKPGDHIFRILMKDFGMSNSAAERLIPEVVRLNDIADIRSLKVGRTLLIPTAKRRPAAKPTVTSPPPEQPPAAAKAEPPAAPPAPATIAEAETPKARPTAAATQPHVKIHPITAKEPAEIFDSLLNALSIVGHKNRIIEAAAGNAFSVKVDRYFEDRGRRFIANCADKDPFSYTLLRLLEVEGYRVIQLNGEDDFRKIATRLLTHLNWPFSYVTHKLPPENGGGEVPGFLVTGMEPGGSQVLVTDVPPDNVPGERAAKDHVGGK